jgi:hydroxymethylpyrimidine/phosphomethylpyrimidine kinase
MSPSPVVLTIAGFDPSSGAGITADIKTIAAHDCYGVACITAITVQTTQGVRRVQALPPALVRDTLHELASDLTFAAVRIGMLDSREVADEVADFLQMNRPPNIVLDPILKSSSGADLLDAAALTIVRDRLLPLATVITPNIDEAAALTGLRVTNLQEAKEAAHALHALGVTNVVITGGHLDPPTDLLSITRHGAAPQLFEIPGEKIASTSTHGTGCAFATSLACNLALGRPLRDGVIAAKHYVTQAIRHAHLIGKGHGPLNHFWK